jgi:hypothetical protein
MNCACCGENKLDVITLEINELKEQTEDIKKYIKVSNLLDKLNKNEMKNIIKSIENFSDVLLDIKIILHCHYQEKHNEINQK